MGHKKSIVPGRRRGCKKLTVTELQTYRFHFDLKIDRSINQYFFLFDSPEFQVLSNLMDKIKLTVVCEVCVTSA
jgi:uncharacterized protein YggL (DUF469 family)